MQQAHYAEIKLIESNQELVRELYNNGVKKLLLSSLGNSISTGYSILNENKPLLKRNDTLEFVTKHYDIKLETHQYARLCNNDDEAMYYLIETNTLESNYNKVIVRDYEAKVKSKEVPDLNMDKILSYYPSELKIDRGVQDVLKDSKAHLANIAILNGGTGSFIENYGYQGRHLLTGGIKRDCLSLEMLLLFIQNLNRNGANTQVYLCGAPRLFYLSDIFLNPKLQEMARRYANVTYVPNFAKKVFYPNNRNSFLIDPHYDEAEYHTLLANINYKIVENYQIKQYMIEIDRVLKLRNTELDGQDKIPTYDEMMSLFERYAKKIEENNHDVTIFLKKLQHYLLERYPYDYFSLDKKAIEDSVRVLKRK